MTAYPSRTHVRSPDEAVPPGLVRALGIVGLVLGTLGVVSSPFAALRFVGDGRISNLFLHDSLWRGMLVSSIASTALSVLLVIAATGCLKLRPWGRRMMIVYSIGSLILGIGGAYFYLKWMGLVGGTPRGQGGVDTWIQLTGWLLSMPYAVWALYMMTRPHAREVFRGPGRLIP
jgi:hypothetical protein